MTITVFEFISYNCHIFHTRDRDSCRQIISIVYRIRFLIVSIKLLYVVTSGRFVRQPTVPS